MCTVANGFGHCTFITYMCCSRKPKFCNCFGEILTFSRDLFSFSYHCFPLTLPHLLAIRHICRNIMSTLYFFLPKKLQMHQNMFFAFPSLLTSMMYRSRCLMLDPPLCHFLCMLANGHSTFRSVLSRCDL